jgi:hypothetical protein
VEPDGLQTFIDDASTAGAALTPAGEELWEPGQVSVCCTTDDDVHAVAAVGNEPTVGIHVYGQYRHDQAAVV